MNPNARKRLLAGILVTMVLIGVPYVSIIGHGDKHENDEPAKDTAADTLLGDSANSVQDSIYALINDNYQIVRHAFKYSCFDCHSDSTHYPWYHSIPGIKGMIDDDIKEAMEHLDLSNDFPFGGHATQVEQLKEIKEEIEDDAMPLQSYRFTHWGRLIEGARRDSVFAWIDESISLLKSTK